MVNKRQAPAEDINLTGDNPAVGGPEKLKAELTKLGVDETVDTQKGKIEVLTTLLEQKEENIKKISKAELAELATHILDNKPEFEGKLEVTNGSIEYTPAAQSVDLLPPPDTTSAEGQTVEGTVETTKKTVQDGLGRVIEKFFYSIKSWLSGKKITFEDHETFQKSIEQAINNKLNIDLSEKPEAEDLVMDKLAVLGIGADDAVAFFDFITNDSANIKTLPSNLQKAFGAGRDNYLAVKDHLNSDPIMAIKQILGFDPESYMIESPQPVAQETETSAAPTETAPPIEAIKFTADGTETTIEASPESTASFRSIQKSAETILGSTEAKIDTKLADTFKENKDAHEKAGDKKPEKGTKILETVSEKLIYEITQKTKIAALQDTEKKKLVDFSTEDKIKEYSLSGLPDKLKIYLQTAFDEIYARAENIIEKKASITSEAKLMLQKSLIGYLREPGKDGVENFTKNIEGGYEKVIAQILKQEKILDGLSGNPDYWNGITQSGTSPLRNIEA